MSHPNYLLDDVLNDQLIVSAQQFRDLPAWLRGADNVVDFSVPAPAHKGYTLDKFVAFPLALLPEPPK